MEASVRNLFERYERTFNGALQGHVAMDEVAKLYTAEFLAASPAGVMTARNDAAFTEQMAQGYAHYREIGTKAMRVRDVRISPIDELHCVAHVAWRAVNAREGEADVMIDFEVHYLVQQLDEEPKVFAWISGDEEAVLKEHGIV